MARASKRWAAGIAAVCAVGLVAGACSKSDDSGGVSKDEQKKSQQEAKALKGTDIISASRDELKQGGTVKFALENYPQNFNSYNADGNDVSNQLAMQPTQASFFNLTEGGVPVIDKDYLTSAEIVKKADPFTVEFKINPKAVWSDGSPITYKDFEGTWKADNGSNDAYQVASTNGFETITSVDKGADDRDVVVKFSQPYAGWQSLFNGVLPASLTASPKTFNDSWKNKPTLSAGPFMISQADSTNEVVTEVPNPKWWGDKPMLDKLIFRAISLNASTNAFKNGEIDMVDAGKDPNTLKAAENVPNTKILRSSSVAWHELNLNAQSPLLKDAKLRQAIAMAIPRDQIARLREEPFGAPTTVKNSLLLGVTQEGYQDNATAAIGPDPDKAKQMLDDLGWKMNGKFRQKDGKTLSLRMVIPSETSSQSDVSQIVQNTLGQLGIKVTIPSVNVNDFFTKYIIPGDFDLEYMGWTGGPFPGCEMKSQFWPAINDQNMANITTPEIGKLFDQACGELDEKARVDIENQLDKDIFALTAHLPLFNDPAVAATNDKLANVKYYTSAFESTDWQDVGWMK